MAEYLRSITANAPNRGTIGYAPNLSKTHDGTAYYSWTKDDEYEWYYNPGAATSVDEDGVIHCSYSGFHARSLAGWRLVGFWAKEVDSGSVEQSRYGFKETSRKTSYGDTYITYNARTPAEVANGNGSYAALSTTSTVIRDAYLYPATAKEDNVDRVTAVFGKYFKVTMKANGGAGADFTKGCLALIDGYYFEDGYEHSFSNYITPLSKTGISRDGYVFTGWNSKADGTGVHIDADAETDVVYNAFKPSDNATVTLYAQWSPKPVITAIAGEGGSVAPESVIVEPGGSATFVATPDEMHDFENWTDEQGDEVDDSPTLELEDITESASYTANFTEKPLYDIDVTEVEGDADVEFSREPDGGEEGWVSGVTITLTPNEGKTIKSWQVVDEDDTYVTGSPSGFVETEDEVKIVITDAMLSGDLTVTAVFGDVVYTADASVDQASATAISSVSVSNVTQETSTGRYVDGDTVRFAANVTDDPGYAFDGWYLNGEKVSSSATYDYLNCPIGGVSLVAKAKSAVGFAVDDATRATVSAFGIDSQGYAVLGSTVSYMLTVNAGYYFTGWYLDNSTPTTLDTTGSFTVSAPVSYTAHTSNIAPRWRIVIKPRDFTGGKFLESEFPETNVTFTDVTAVVAMQGGGSEHNPILSAPAETEPPRTDAVESSEYGGVSYIRVDVPTSFQVDGDGAPVEMAFLGWYDSEPTQDGPQGEKFDGGPSTVFLLSGGSRTIYAVYGNSQPVEVKADIFYGDAEKGSVHIDFSPGEGESISEDLKRAIVKQGHSITLVAQPNSQFRFIGWCTSATDPNTRISSSPTFTFSVLTGETYYAHFDVDPNAIYEWEGADTNKLLEWRSKVYKGAIPFNPTSCRVDAVGYPVVRFRVEMFSAPDDDPTAIATLDNAGAIQSDRARRLPIRRLERYMAVDVQSNTEIDTMTVGTSMEGLRQ